MLLSAAAYRAPSSRSLVSPSQLPPAQQGRAASSSRSLDQSPGAAVTPGIREATVAGYTAVTRGALLPRVVVTGLSSREVLQPPLLPSPGPPGGSLPSATAVASSLQLTSARLHRRGRSNFILSRLTRAAQQPEPELLACIVAASGPLAASAVRCSEEIRFQPGAMRPSGCT
jgi:hypothetical protein